LPEVLNLADRITVLRNGKKVATVAAHTTNESDIIKLMIAKNLDQQYPKTNLTSGDERIKVDFVDSDIKKERQIGFSICAGEIIGFAGLVGSGRSELAKKIFEGHGASDLIVTLSGKVFKPKNPSHSIANGIVMIPENRRVEGLITAFGVGENLAIPRLSVLSRLGFRNEKLIRKRGDQIISDLAIKVFSASQVVSTLSGGNQQKVSLGKWLDTEAKLWIFDEPTQGIDVETKSEIYLIMEKLASKGAGIWFISSDLRELEAIADSILVMRESRICSKFQRPFTTEKILEAMLGKQKKKEVYS